MDIAKDTIQTTLDWQHAHLQRRKNGEKTMFPYLPRGKMFAKKTAAVPSIKSIKPLVLIWMDSVEHPKKANNKLYPYYPQKMMNLHKIA